MTKIITTAPSKDDGNDESKSNGLVLKNDAMSASETPVVKTEFDGIEFPELKDRAQAFVVLDKLLVQNEARGTIYELALGLNAKQVKVTLQSKRLKGKKLKTAFDGYMSSLGLSSARSPRTILRYMQLAEKMTDDGTLSDTVRDALKAAKFDDTLKTTVTTLTNGVGITKLYEKYGMVSEKQPKDKVEQTVEDRLMNEVISLVNTHAKLMKLRGEMVGAGEAIDPALDQLIDKTCEAARSIANHPVIKAMLKKLEGEQVEAEA